MFVFALATRAAEPSTNEFVPEDSQLWIRSMEFRGAVGYKDNLTLNRTASEQSLLIGSGADFTLARLPLDGKQFNLLLSLDDIRYPEGKEVTHEDLAVAIAQYKVDLSPRWRLGLDGRYLFQDQVVDTSVTETNIAATLIRGHGIALMPNVNHALGRNFWWEGSGLAQRQYYREPLDDYWEGGPKLTAGRDYGYRSSLTLSYSWVYRAYDTREQISLAGTNLPGTSLHFAQHEVELAWRQNWDALRRWRTATRLGFQVNQENGPGFYDYKRYALSQQVRYVASNWEMKIQGRVSFYDFESQTVSATDSDLRKKATVNVSARGERKLGKYWRLFAEYEYEQSLSNQLLDEYRVNRIDGGVRVEF